MLRILHVLNRVPYPLYDGGSVAQYNMSRMLSGYPNVTYGVFAMNTTRHWVSPEIVSSLFSADTVLWAPVDNRITLTRVVSNLFGTLPFHISRYRSQQCEEALLCAMKEFNPNIVLAEGLPPLLYRSIIHVPGKRLVYRAHNIEHLIWQRLSDESNNPIRRHYYRIQSSRLKEFENSLFMSGDIDAIVTLTSIDALTIQQFGFRGLVHVAPFTVDISQYKPSFAPENQPSVFHLGSLQWLPNRQALEWFLHEVFPLVRQEFPDITFKVAGYNPNGYRLPQTKGVIQLGTVIDAKEFIRQHSILIVPLKAGSGIRIKIIEAMALGKAVVSTSLGAEGIECEHNVNILIADTAEEFAYQLSRCFSEPDLIEYLGRNARRLIEERYSSDVVSGPLGEFLSSVATVSDE